MFWLFISCLVSRISCLGSRVFLLKTMWRKLFPFLLTILGAALLPSLGVAQEGANRAGLVVRFGDGRVVQACVHFAEESLSGDELLARSGLPVILQPSGIGAAVCKIGNEGCDYPAQDCFCKCTGADCAYWALSRLEGRAWRYSNQGASNVQVHNGDVQGWAWGAGSTQGGAAPPVRSLAQLCDLATAKPPTAAPPPTRRPARPPTARPPSATSAPVEEATATSAPTSTGEPTAIVPTATQLPTTAATSVVGPGATPTASPEIVAALPAPTSAPADAAPPPQSEVSSSPPSGYIALAALLGVLLIGFGVVVWRRRS